jgi:hypothetical protein
MTSLPSAAAAPLAGAIDDPRTLTLVLTMCGVLLLGAIVVAVAQRWRRRQDQPLSASDQLAQFRELYEEGELSEEEFNRLRKLLGGQLRKELPAGGGDPGLRDRKPPTVPTAESFSQGAPPKEPPPPSPPAAPPAPPDEGIRPA